MPGHKSEFALREFATMPGELTLSAVRDIKSARYLWRAKGAERADRRKEAAEKKEGGGGAAASAAGETTAKGNSTSKGKEKAGGIQPLPVKGLDLEVKSKSELRLQALKANHQDKGGVGGASGSTSHMCFTDRRRP